MIKHFPCLFNNEILGEAVKIDFEQEMRLEGLTLEN